MVKSFKVDYETLLDAQKATPSTAIVVVIKRSVFNNTSVNQFVEIFEATGWQWDLRVHELVMKRYVGGIATQICEGCIGPAKNAGAGHGTRLYRRPEVAMLKILQQKVIELKE